jgi:hypothetical protein
MNSPAYFVRLGNPVMEADNVEPRRIKPEQSEPRNWTMVSPIPLYRPLYLQLALKIDQSEANFVPHS